MVGAFDYQADCMMSKTSTWESVLAMSDYSESSACSVATGIDQNIETMIIFIKCSTILASYYVILGCFYLVFFLSVSGHLVDVRNSLIQILNGKNISGRRSQINHFSMVHFLIHTNDFHTIRFFIIV